VVFGLIGGPLAIEASHKVALPEGGSLFAQLPRPDWSAFARPSTWSVGLTIGVVASLETLLSLEASVKLDRQHRLVSADRELLAQGAGNLLCGLLGGVPLTGVIVRTTANVEAGGATRFKLLDKTFQPEAGKLLCWNNRLADGRVNDATLHHGMKVRKGVKYVITKWYREQQWQG
jgi:hypothetical protein